MKYKLLIVDDEKDIRTMLGEYFTLSGYDVCLAGDAESALKQLGYGADLVLLDINMPDVNGIELCERIRKHVDCPIIFLTARTDEQDKLHGFAAGADDYVEKPFSLDVLGARVNAHLKREDRRAERHRSKFEGDLTVDYAEKAVYVNGNKVPLVKKEFEILDFLSSNACQVFDKERIYERLWGYDSEGNSAVVAEHIRRIRTKLATAGCRNHIETVWGMGYKWVR